MDNPIAPETVKALSETLYEHMDLKGRTTWVAAASMLLQTAWSEK